MQRVRVKICGITRHEDAYQAVTSGADALGFVFYPKSPRYISPQQASAIVKQLPPFVTLVGLFVDPTPEYLHQVLAEVPLNLLQFHGKESEQFCEQFSFPYIKALRMKSGVNIAEEIARYSSAKAILLDAYKPGVPGGTGEAFDWDRVPTDIGKPIILAGGLNVDNVQRAIEKVRPFAVDLSGGVEISPGIKDHGKISDFIDKVISR